MKSGLSICLFAVVLFAGCKKSALKAHIPPTTTIFVSAINLTGANRLSSTVQLAWQGYSQDGYIVGYQLSFDNVNWTYTKSTDSTFHFILTNEDSLNINFYVRAIDNYGLKDPHPAHIVIPVKSTPPVVSITKNQFVKDTAFAVVTLPWTATDVDGSQTIDSVFIKINNGHWFSVKADTSLVTLVPVNPMASGATTAKVYLGANAMLLGGNIDGLVLNGLNRIYMRGRNLAGAYGAQDSTISFYWKNQTSNLLVIDGVQGFTAAGILLPAVLSTNGSYDYINYNISKNKNAPYYWNPTFQLLISLYKEVFIYTDNEEINGSLILESAASAFQTYLNNNGKILISTQLTSALSTTSPLFQYAPLDSILHPSGTPPPQARIATDSAASPNDTNAAGYPTLVSNVYITGVEPFYPSFSAKIMYRGHLTKLLGWNGPNVVSAKLLNPNNKTNLVFWSVPLQDFDQNPNSLTAYFNDIFKNEFNW